MIPGSVMYSTCLHCNAQLGRNDVVEHFQVGRRLAFDSAKGRLWVICPSCQRWNLTPLEERWEAIEECERLFRDTRLRTSTDNIGLARSRGGLDLIRIGAPLRHEIAAWRYGAALQRRWKEHWRVFAAENAATLTVVTVTATMFSVGMGSPIVGILCTGLGMAGSMSSMRNTTRDIRARVVMPDGQVTNMRSLTASGVRMVVESTDDGGWALRSSRQNYRTGGPSSARTLRSVLAYRNAAGGDDAAVASAVDHLASSPDARTFINRIANAARTSGLEDLATYPREALLALEMALHDDTERQAMAGELQALAGEWEIAEEIAGIADDMFLPEAVRARFEVLSARRRGAP
ncbi:MAG: hypothetical protein ABJE47_00080 [bacterium]